MRVILPRNSMRSTFQILSIMEQVKKRVFQTFTNSSHSGDVFEANMKKLLTVMDKLTAEDVKLDKTLLVGQHAAPVTYIAIWEHPKFTINMFVLRPESKLPLHDHPLMHGICKVVHGKVMIRNFSLTEENSALRLNRVLTLKEPDRIVTDKDPAVLLTPNKGNIHEIRAVDGGAAFVDILAPPYLSDIEGIGPRPCNYFMEAGEREGFTELVKIDKVPEYWTDLSPYLGP